MSLSRSQPTTFGSIVPPTRGERIRSADERVFDVLVIGGGVHGAMVCREATLRGYSVLLLEAQDYGAATSSRSSKMLHGGVRYLETGDFGLIREALLERESLLEIAPHLTRVQEFLMPAIRGKTRPGWQIEVGLTVYDLLARWGGGKKHTFPKHRRVRASESESGALREFGLEFEECFSYFDGQMDDARIVIEAIVDATQLGAVTVNYGEVTGVSRDGGTHAVQWRDHCTGEEHRSRAKFLVNAAGPWVPQFAGETLLTQQIRPVYSRGTHLLFDREWSGPGLILPTGVAGRYYFVWPLFLAGAKQTLVGTTDVELHENEPEPTPSESEVEELLGLVAKDLPHSGLTRETLYSTFSGVRILGACARKHRQRRPPESISNIAALQDVRWRRWTTIFHQWQKLLGACDMDRKISENSGPTSPFSVVRVRIFEMASSGRRRLCLWHRLLGERIAGGRGALRSIFGRARTVSSLSRSLVLLRSEGAIGLLGGKYTSARKVGEDVAGEIDSFFGRAPQKRVGLLRPLPGGEGWHPALAQVLQRELEEQGVNQEEAAAAVHRFGVRVRSLKGFGAKKEGEAVGGSDPSRAVILSQIRYTVSVEQAITVEDVLRRRLGLALLPGGGGEWREAIEQELSLQQ